LQPFAGLQQHRLAEFPFAPKALALEFTRNHILLDENAEIAAPDAPGLGIEIDPAGVRKYLIDVEIKVSGKLLFRSLPGV